MWLLLGELASPYIWHRDPKSLSATSARHLCVFGFAKFGNHHLEHAQASPTLQCRYYIGLLPRNYGRYSIYGNHINQFFCLHRPWVVGCGALFFLALFKSVLRLLKDKPSCSLLLLASMHCTAGGALGIRVFMYDATRGVDPECTAQTEQRVNHFVAVCHSVTSPMLWVIVHHNMQMHSSYR
jgi:hypothetical protein